ncbi:hypothetical protein [Vibrio bathopelagicus]
MKTSNEFLQRRLAKEASECLDQIESLLKSVSNKLELKALKAA